MSKQRKIKRRRKEKKTFFIAYIFMMILVGLLFLISPSFSYFSDQETISASIQAGTLDFSANTPFYITMTPLINYNNPINLTNLGSIDDFKYYSQVEEISGDLCSSLTIKTNEDGSFFCPLEGYVSPTKIFSENPTIDANFHLESGPGTCSFYLRITAHQTDCMPGFSDEELVYFEITASAGDNGINVEKTSDKSSISSGETVIYTYTVTNTGDYPLQNVTINDDTCSPISTATGDTNTNSILEKEETWIYTCSTQLTQTTTNTVTVTAINELQNQVSDTDDLTVTVGTNNPGCTLTQGYWKNHSWPGGIVGMPIWFTVEALKTPVKGNAWYQLAHQYIAAYLNSLSSAFVPPEVQNALDDAKSLLGDEIIEVTEENKAPFIDAAEILVNYNEGLSGVPHCPD